MLRLRTIVNWLWIVVALLSVAGFAVVVVRYQVGDVPRSIAALFDLDQETTFATWFSSTLFAASGTVCLLVARSSIFLESLERYWRWLGFLLWIFSIDEAVSLHERSDFGIELSGLEISTWVVPGTLFVAVLGVWFLRGLILKLPKALRQQVFLAAAVYVIGALGLEFLEAAIANGLFFGVEDDQNLPYEIVSAIQETLEMAGLVLLLKALLGIPAATKDPLSVAIT